MITVISKLIDDHPYPAIIEVDTGGELRTGRGCRLRDVSEPQRRARWQPRSCSLGAAQFYSQEFANSIEVAGDPGTHDEVWSAALRIQ